MSLKSRATIRVVIAIPFIAALVLGPAGSLRFWQGWIFVVFNAVGIIVFTAYFYRRDPQLLERRLKSKEPRREQRKFKMLWAPLWFCTILLPGLDYRFGWSVAFLGGVPVWLTAGSLVVTLIGWMLVFYVLRFNSFAASIVQVEAGQKVIADGPYRVVRHPMYSGFSLLILATPFALGSYVDLAPAVLLIPVLVLRLHDEERLLRQELSGYAEYCEHTRFRLLPWVF